MCVYVLTIWPEQFECRTTTESTTSLEHQWLWKWKRKPARSVPFVPFHGPSPLCLDLFLPQRERRGGWELLSRSYSTPSSSLNPPPPKIHIWNINSLWKYRKPNWMIFFSFSFYLWLPKAMSTIFLFCGFSLFCTKKNDFDGREFFGLEVKCRSVRPAAAPLSNPLRPGSTNSAVKM